MCLMTLFDYNILLIVPFRLYPVPHKIEFFRDLHENCHLHLAQSLSIVEHTAGD